MDKVSNEGNEEGAIDETTVLSSSQAVRQTCTAVFFNKGENCIAAGRIFVAKSIHDDFIKKLVEETKKVYGRGMK